MLAEICLKRVRVRAHHGVLPQERVVGADFYVSLTAVADVSDEALSHDSLQGTVDYGKLVEVVKREMHTPSALLEHAAMRIAKSVIEEFPTVVRVTVLLEKENPPLGVQSEGVGFKIMLAR